MTTIDLNYNAFRWSTGIIRQLEMTLKLGKSFFHIEAKSRAREAKKLTPSLEPSRLREFCNVPFRLSFVAKLGIEKDHATTFLFWRG